MSYDTPGYVDADKVVDDLTDIRLRLEYIDPEDRDVDLAIGDVVDVIEEMIDAYRNY